MHGPRFTGGGRLDPSGIPWNDGEEPVNIPCPYCDNGIIHNVNLPYGWPGSETSDHTCPICYGTGEISPDLELQTCNHCFGKGFYDPNPGDMDTFTCATCVGVGKIPRIYDSSIQEQFVLGLIVLLVIVVVLSIYIRYH